MQFSLRVFGWRKSPAAWLSFWSLGHIMRLAFLLVLVGLLTAGYSFVGDAHLWTHWPDIVGTKADIGTSQQRPAGVPYDAIVMTFHRDWMIVRYFGVATFVVGIAGLFYGRHKPVA